MYSNTCIVIDSFKFREDELIQFFKFSNLSAYHGSSASHPDVLVIEYGGSSQALPDNVIDIQVWWMPGYKWTSFVGAPKPSRICSYFHMHREFLTFESATDMLNYRYFNMSSFPLLFDQHPADYDRPLACTVTFLPQVSEPQLPCTIKIGFD